MGLIADTKTLMTNPAIKGMVGYYAPGNVGKIQNWSDLTGGRQDISKVYESGIQNALLKSVDDSIRDYPKKPLTVGYTDISGVGSKGEKGYFSHLDQFKAMGSALMGNPSSIANLSTGRFNVDWTGDITNPEERKLFLRDIYNYDKSVDDITKLWGAGPYSINAQIPRKVVDKIFTWQDRMLMAKRQSESNARMQQRIRQAEAAETNRIAKEKADAAAQAQAQAQAQASQRQADQARISRAYREETGGQAGSYAPGGGSGAHAADASGSTYSDPFDPGGGEAQGGFIDGTNRRRNYLNGGLINFFKYGGFIG